MCNVAALPSLFYHLGTKDMDKQEAIKIVCDAAIRYQTNLVGKKMMVLYLGNDQKVESLEIVFMGTNFLHLTGLKLISKISTSEFYQRCLEGKLSENDIAFAKDGTTVLKLRVLPKLMANNLSANMVGDFSANSIKLYTQKLIGGVTACLGFVKDGNVYYPNTLLSTDIRNMVFKPMRIVAIFQKEFEQAHYEKKTYQAKKLDCSSLKFPKDIEYLKELLIAEDK